jgi:restriction endonuclease S subunit
MDSNEHINDEGVKHSNVKLVKKGSILMSFKMSIGKCAIAGVDLYTNEAIVAFYSNNESILSNKYLFYYLSLRDLSNAGRGSIGAGSMNKESLSELTMPLPPLEIQNQIVATLDRIYNPGTAELADMLKMTDKAMDLVLANPAGTTLEPIVEAQRLMRKSAQMVADVKAQMVADVKAQMVAIVKASSSKAPNIALKDVCAVAFGERITQKEHKGTMYPVYGGGEANFHTDRFNREGATCKVARFAVSEKTMVLMIDKKYWLMDSGFTVSSKDKSRVIDEYMWWILWANQSKLSACSTGSCQKNISMDMFYSLEFGFPPLEIQKCVVEKIKMLQTQLTALETLQKQSEDNARFILESYLNSTGSSIPLEKNNEEIVDYETSTNKIIHPEESSTPPSDIKVIKRRKPKISTSTTITE